MIASYKDLEELVKLMEFETEDNRRPFNPAEQLQSASIDLRLDRVFWFPRSGRYRRAIDLRKPIKDNREIERFFERRIYKFGDGIVLPPGAMIMGRIYESFRVPNEYAGVIKGRSSFARLGLSIHCTGDFVNPGWKGYMPLQLINHGKVPIILTPYIGICQLMLIRLMQPSTKPYGSSGLNNKYMNDEGAPSRYWEDIRLQKLQEAIGRTDLHERIKAVFRKILESKDGDMLDRFHDFLDKLPSRDITNAREVLEQFARRDSLVGKREAAKHHFFKWLPFALVTASLGVFFREPYGFWHYSLWIFNAILVLPGIYFQYLAAPPPNRFTLK